jgi:hypothetical protein
MARKFEIRPGKAYFWVWLLPKNISPIYLPARYTSLRHLMAGMQVLSSNLRMTGCSGTLLSPPRKTKKLYQDDPAEQDVKAE